MLNIVIGLIGLGIIITIHEFGHYIFARICGVEVEVFSIGFGPKLISWQLAGTEFRISLIPLGGYCRMKGSKEFAQALAEKKEYLETEKGAFYCAPWGKRICILLAGPFLNIVTAILLYAGLYAIGYPIDTVPNKIIIADDHNSNLSPTPAAQAGLQTGDILITLDGTTINSFYDIQNIVTYSAEKELSYTAQRGTDRITGVLTPQTIQGSGRIGVYPWIEPIVTNIDTTGPAAIAGLEEGDRITSANGVPVNHSLDLSNVIAAIGGTLPLQIMRNAQTYTFDIPLDSEKNLGFELPTIVDTRKSENILVAGLDALRTTISFIGLTFRGIGMLFTGSPLEEVISGPGQLIFSIGSISTNAGGGFSFSRFVELIAIISIAIAIMNLLPIPVTDGGQLLIPIIEAIRTKPLSLRFQQRYQMLGVALIFFILIIALWQDISFFRGL